MTESAYFSSAARRDCFVDLGVEEYKIVATLDSKTSKICREFDGKHFPVKDFHPGATAPPFHCYCRSDSVPYFGEDFGGIGKRAARGKDGKSYYVPGDISYGEWEKAFVEGDKTGLTENNNSDVNNAKQKEPKLQDLTNSQESGIITKKYREFHSGDEVNAFFYYDDEKRGLKAKQNSSYGKWKSGLSTEQKNAVSDYTTGGYSDLNDYLRHTNDWEYIDVQTMEQFKTELQSVTSSFKLKEPIKVYRYTGIDTFGEKNLKELIGTEFVDNGFMSASPLLEGVENAVVTGKDILLEISVPNGKEYGAYINDLSAWKNIEYEFLFTCGASFDIVSVDTNGDIPIIRMVAK